MPIRLEDLVGRWRDAPGHGDSTYRLSLDSQPHSITVETTRYNGYVRRTRALIKLDPTSGCITWGQAGTHKFLLGSTYLVNPDHRVCSFQWETPRRQSWVWVRDESDESDAFYHLRNESQAAYLARWSLLPGQTAIIESVCRDTAQVLENVSASSNLRHLVFVCLRTRQVHAGP